MRSVSSSSSGAGGLCEVRIALTPIARMISSWRSMARVFTAAPSAPRSWCRHTPRIFTRRPFRKNPESALKTNDRNPNGVVYVSHALFPHMTRATARYKYGRSSDQRAGRAIVRSCAISVTESPGTRPVVDTTATAFPAESYMVVRNAIACSAGRALRMVVRIVTRAESALAVGVVTYVPH